MENGSIIKLLSETLKFYAEEANYDNNQMKMDRGFQARHALDSLRNLQSTMDKLETDYNKYVEELNKAKTPEDIIKDINNLLNK